MVSSEAKPTAYVVMGMHRSGTSALSGKLVERGGRPPATPLPPNAFNAKGYFESKKVVVLNDSLLGALGSSWLSFAAPAWDLMEPEARSTAQTRIADTVKDEFGSADGAVIKDPRISLLASLWLPALEAVGIAPRVVISVRRPREVVASIARRDNMNRYRVVYLWLRYYLEAELQTRRHARAFVHFDDVLEDWDAVERRLQATVGMPFADRQDAGTRAAADGAQAPDRSPHTQAPEAFIDASLATRDVAEHAVDASAAMALADKVYDLLVAAATQGKLDAAGRKQLDRIRQRFNKATAIFEPFISLTESYTRQVGRELTALKAELAAGNAKAQSDADAKAAEALTQRANILRQQLDEANADRLRMARVIEDQFTQGIAATQSLSDAESRAALAQAALAEAEQRQAERDAALEQYQAERDAARSAAEAAEARARALQTEADALREATDTLTAQAHALGANADRATARADTATQRITELDAQLSLERSERRAAEAHRDRLAATVKTLSARAAAHDEMAQKVELAESAAALAERRLHDALAAQRREKTDAEAQRHEAKSLEIQTLETELALLRLHDLSEYPSPAPRSHAGDREAVEGSGKGERDAEGMPGLALEGDTVADNAPAGGPPQILAPVEEASYGVDVAVMRVFGKDETDASADPGGVWESESRLLSVSPASSGTARTLPVRPTAAADGGADATGHSRIATADRRTPRATARPPGQGVSLNSRQVELLRAGFREDVYVAACDRLGLAVEGEPFTHYLEIGLAENVSAHPLFDGEWYAERYPDLSAFSDRYYLHYLQYGESEGRQPMPLFDPQFYLATNPDVRRSGLPAHVHYLDYGAEEGRLPNPWFYSQWYLSRYPEAKLAGTCALLDYYRVGEAEGRRPHPHFSPVWYHATYLKDHPTRSQFGALESYLRFGTKEGHTTGPGQAPPTNDTRLKILMVAHSASERVYGSERSFLDVLETVDATRFKLIVALPNPSEAYLSLASAIAEQVHIVPTRWWQDGQPVDESLVAFYAHLIDEQKIDLVYANTIMLREPAIAARAAGIPNIIHIREAIDKDPDLLDYIGLSAGEIVRQVVNRADHVIGNSQKTLDVFGAPETGHLVYNAVDPDHYADIAPAGDADVLRVGMMSSNLPKKGIADVVELATLAQKKRAGISFHLFGPPTDETRRLGKAISKAGLTNIAFEGYVDDPREAVAELDVVLNFSHFAESFGRTIAEAGSAGRPAIVYNRGALPEVVQDGVTGHVIPFGKPRSALPHLVTFAQDRDCLRRMGEAARDRAREHFSFGSLRKAINGTLSDILGAPGGSASGGAADASGPLTGRASAVAADGPGERPVAPVTVVVPNYNYEAYLEERLKSIFSQTYRPAHIVFLDDNSSDNSVKIAEPLLYASGIPYSVVVNTENRGVYAQWLTGFAKAATEWVWIAEADDRCEPDFLEKLLSGPTGGLNILYSQSRKIDGEGALIVPDNRAHSNDVSRTRWNADYVTSGTREVVDALCFRNTIPNASAVLMRRSALEGAAEVLEGLRYTGDWKLYAHLLRTGGIRFVSESLNHFRRHRRSVTRQKGKEPDYLKELADIRLYMTTHFPIRTEELDRMDWFLDRDYRIDGVSKNSRSELIADALDTARRIARPRRRLAFITTNNGSFYGGSEMLWRESAMALAEEGHDVIALIKKWDPRPDFLDELEAAHATVLFKEEDGFDTLVALDPELCAVSLGDQDEGLEFYPTLIERGIPYVIINQLTKEARFWPIRAQKTEGVRAGYASAETAFFTCWNNQRVMEERLDTKLPNAALHYNPYHIDRGHVPAWPEGPTTHIAIPSKLLFIHKGQDLLADFLGEAQWQTRDVVFNFYGIGPDEENLRALAEAKGIRNFAFHGRVADISTIWDTNHALLMPSRMEGLPIMLVSAMLSARPAIVTDIGGHAEVVTDGESGFIAANPTVEDVRDALERAWSRRAEWETMGRQARKSILEFLPEDPVADFTGKLLGIADRLQQDETKGEAA